MNIFTHHRIFSQIKDKSFDFLVTRDLEKCIQRKDQIANKWKIGFADNFKNAKESKNIALPQTIKDPRYKKIKETLTKTLKRPKNYLPNSNLAKYKENEDKMKNMLVKLPN